MTTPTEHDREALVKRALATAGLSSEINMQPIAELLGELIAALSAQGGEQTADTVPVPREPTETMVNAGFAACSKQYRNKYGRISYKIESVNKKHTVMTEELTPLHHEGVIK